MNEFVQAIVTVTQLAQTDGISIEIGTADGLVGGAVGAFLTTLVVGAIMVAIAPEYVDRTTTAVLEEPLGSFLYGFLSLVAVLFLAFVLSITIVGILVALPLVLVAYVVWAIGSAVAYLAIGERLVGREDGWLKPLLVGAGINGLLALSGIGGLLAFAIGATGFGTVLREHVG